MDSISIIRDKYTLRPWRYSDIETLAALDMEAFTPPHSNDNLFDVLFPGYAKTPQTRAEATRVIANIFKGRYFSRDFISRVLQDPQTGQIVAYSSWKKPPTTPSAATRILSWFNVKDWYYWFARLATVTIPTFLWPIAQDFPGIGAMARIMDPIEDQILNTPRRKNAWYLSKVTVDPSAQGQGLGRLMIEEGLAHIDAHGDAVWLVGMRDLDAMYAKFGFKSLARANVGELAAWVDSGHVMMRE